MRFRTFGQDYASLGAIPPVQPEEVKEQMEEPTVDVDVVMGFVHAITQHGNNVARFAAAGETILVYDELVAVQKEAQSAIEYLIEEDPNRAPLAIFTVPEEERP